MGMGTLLSRFLKYAAANQITMAALEAATQPASVSERKDFH
jgi:hypothetical protein